MEVETLEVAVKEGGGAWLDVIGADGTVLHTTSHAWSGSDAEWVVDVVTEPWVRLTKTQLFIHVSWIVRVNAGCRVVGELGQEFIEWWSGATSG